MERLDYLGMSWDGQSGPSQAALEPLAGAPWFDYRELWRIDIAEHILAVPACISSVVAAKRAVICPVARDAGPTPSLSQSARIVRIASTLIE